MVNPEILADCCIQFRNRLFLWLEPRPVVLGKKPVQ